MRGNGTLKEGRFGIVMGGALGAAGLPDKHPTRFRPKLILVAEVGAVGRSVSGRCATMSHSGASHIGSNLPGLKSSTSLR